MLLAASAVRAEEVPAATPQPIADAIVPPEPLEIPEISPPSDAFSTPVEVRARLRVGIDGSVAEVLIESGGGEAFDAAVQQGARRFRFRPATLRGEPVEVILPYTHTFVPLPPPVARAPEGPAFDAVLEGQVMERGTRAPALEAAVVARTSAGERVASTDSQGRFELALPSGPVEVLVAATGCRRFLQTETLQTGERLRVRYLVTRESFGRMEVVVTAPRDRTEVSRTVLEGREISRVPGTFGDPFRVVAMLPGVGQVMSLLPLPVVRGTSPGSTGFFLDGARLPMLFHLFSGPAVVHPEFVERVEFHPGGFPVAYGGYTGGIVDGQTRAASPDERRFDLDMNLLQTGLFVRAGVPSLGLGATVAGRIGYPALMLSAVTPDVSFGYWDYQTRFDGEAKGLKWTIFVYGAKDELEAAMEQTPPGQEPKLETVARFEFHRADLRGRFGGEKAGGEVRLVAGLDDTRMGGETTGVSTRLLQPMLAGHWALSDALRLRAGADVAFKDNRQEVPADANGELPPGTASTDDNGLFVSGGVWVDAPWRPGDGLVLVPGVRADAYRAKTATQWSLDPRLLARWRAWPTSRGGVWLKGVAGLYHQPPRLFLPVPGADESSLSLGLLQSLQTGIGAELSLAPGVELDVQSYFAWMDPVLFDLAVNPQPAAVRLSPPPSPPWEEPPQGSTVRPEDDMLAQMMRPRKGRAYGLEILLRKRDSQRLFGWIAYTLSRSERLSDSGWAPFDFDRTHMLNVVAGTRLAHNWEIGGRLLVQTGTPVTTIFDYNGGRTELQVRADLRIDKRAVYDAWMLDFYVDVVNLLVTPESGGLVGAFGFRYVLPTVGFRAVL